MYMEAMLTVFDAASNMYVDRHFVGSLNQPNISIKIILKHSNRLHLFCYPDYFSTWFEHKEERIEEGSDFLIRFDKCLLSF